MKLNFDDSSITVAIVGCGGFIGSHLLQAIWERTKWRVFGVDLDSYRIQEHLNNSRFEFVSENIANESIVKRIAKFPVVINLAAICTPGRYMKDAVEVIHSNFTHPAQLADACANSGAWLIHFSTSEIYGKTSANSSALFEDTTDIILGSVLASRWSYATAKLLTERYLAGLNNLKYTIVRPFNFIGPFMDFMPGVDGQGIPRVLANFSTALLRNEPLKLVNGGSAKRSFTSVHDAIDFMFCLFNNIDKAFGQAFNVGNENNEVSILQLAELMQNIYAKIVHKNIDEISHIQNVLATDFYGIGYEDSMRRMPSVAKAKSLLNFYATISLEVALRESLEWFVKHYAEC